MKTPLRLLALAALAACDSCNQNVDLGDTCNVMSCGSGCCSEGKCQGGADPFACGKQAEACRSCAQDGLVCVDHACVAGSGGGAGGGQAGTGGGSVGTGGGTTGTGGGTTGTGGGSTGTGGGTTGSGGGSMTCTTNCTNPPQASCNGPIARTWLTQGTCSQGTCAYVPIDTTCGFGCTGGVCQTDPCAGVTCNATPAALCVTPNTARRFTTPGICAQGACSYTSGDTSCAFGCTAGACNPPSCGATGSCGSTPPASCPDANTRRHFQTNGYCDAGNCSYASLESYCSNGCLNGRCLNGSSETYWLPVPASFTHTAIDGAGLSHFLNCSTDVNYYWFAEGTWGRETVATGQNCGFNAIALAPDGHPFAVWFEPVNRDLRIAERTGANTWAQDLVANVGDVGSLNALAVDPTGVPWALWLDKTRHQIRASRRTSPGVWTDELVHNGELSPYDGYLDLQVAAGGKLYALVSETQAYDAGVVSHVYVRGATSWSKVDSLDAGSIELHTAANGDLELSWFRRSDLRPTDTLGMIRRYRDAGTVDDWFGGYTELVTTASGTSSVRGFGVVNDRINGEWVSRQIPRVNSSSGGRSAGDAPDRRVRELGAYPSRTGYLVDAPCVAQCSGRDCGDDGCGGSCGTCTAGQYCAPAGTCGRWKVDPIPQNDFGPNEAVALRANGTRLRGLTLYAGAATELLSYDTGSWKRERVPFEVFGAADALTVDAAGRVLVARVENMIGGPLVLSTHDAAGWTNTTLAGNAALQSPSIALAADGTPRIVYFERGASNAGKLRFGRPQGAAWVFEDVAALPREVLFTSLVIDATGAAHALYVRGESTTNGNATLDYATNRSGSWVVTNVRASVGMVSSGYPPHLLLDAAGVLHLVFFDDALNVVTYGQKPAASGAFTLENVPGTTQFSWPADLVVLPAGPALIIRRYTPPDNGFDLRIRTGPGAYTTEPIPLDEARVGFTVDGTGTLHGFYGLYDGALRHVRRF